MSAGCSSLSDSLGRRDTRLKGPDGLGGHGGHAVVQSVMPRTESTGRRLQELHFAEHANDI